MQSLSANFRAVTAAEGFFFCYSFELSASTSSVIFRRG